MLSLFLSVCLRLCLSVCLCISLSLSPFIASSLSPFIASAILIHFLKLFAVLTTELVMTKLRSHKGLLTQRLHERMPNASGCCSTQKAVKLRGENSADTQVFFWIVPLVFAAVLSWETPWVIGSRRHFFVVGGVWVLRPNLDANGLVCVQIQAPYWSGCRGGGWRGVVRE